MHERVLEKWHSMAIPKGNPRSERGVPENPHPLLELQRSHGNRYVQRVLAPGSQGTGATEVSEDVEQEIQRTRGGGQALDQRVRGQMEPLFGSDFSNVRVHTGEAADRLNRAVSARAFTTGNDIFFGAGEYNPESSKGRELLAHELTHVVQQSSQIQAKLTVSSPGDRYEQEADKVAREVGQQRSNDLLFESLEAHKGCP